MGKANCWFPVLGNPVDVPAGFALSFATRFGAALSGRLLVEVGSC